MPFYLSLSARFLDASFHGRGDGGKPEWPPSPLRMFQALVSAAASRWQDARFKNHIRPALEWLEGLKCPLIVASVGRQAASAFRTYVPNNVADLVAAAWTRGTLDASIADYRVEKDILPTRLVGSQAVHYLFPLATDGCPHLPALATAARSITHLGWGIDMVAGNATMISDAEAAKLPGERWRPVEGTAGTGYRVPILGTLEALIRKHQAFLNRLGPDGFRPVPPLAAFRVVSYRRAADVSDRPHVAFKLLHPLLERSAWFSPTDANRVAAMTRHAAANAAKGQPSDWVDSYIHGHGADANQARPRFSYLPLPTLEHRRGGAVVLGGIRRVIVAELTESATSYRPWARQILPGQFLIDQQSQEPRAMLAPANKDWVLQQYTDSSEAWATVTPVVLPGSDDGKRRKAERLFVKALRHSGYPPELLADCEFRNVPFWAGSDLALRFQRPDYLKNGHWSVYHMRIRWTRPVSGPLALGAGRHCGLGIFARTNY
jgi:CRISPR-associated protein Csb2